MGVKRMVPDTLSELSLTAKIFCRLVHPHRENNVIIQYNNNYTPGERPP